MMYKSKFHNLLAFGRQCDSVPEHLLIGLGDAIVVVLFVVVIVLFVFVIVLSSSPLFPSRAQPEHLFIGLGDAFLFPKHRFPARRFTISISLKRRRRKIQIGLKRQRRSIQIRLKRQRRRRIQIGLKRQRISPRNANGKLFESFSRHVETEKTSDLANGAVQTGSWQRRHKIGRPAI